MDVRVRNKKTGEEKILPQKVAEMLKNVYTIIKSEPVKTEPVIPQSTVVEVTKKNEDVDVVNESADADKAALRAQYEEKFGKKAPGKMGVESLQKAIDNAG